MCNYIRESKSRWRRKYELVLLGLLVHIITSTEAEQAVTQVLDSMLTQYDKAVRPYYGEKPVEVEISVFVLAVYEINDANMDFTLMMYLRQSWTDPRLAFKPHRGINRNGSNNTVDVDENRSKSLWIPDTFVVNQKKTLRHVDTSVNEFVRVNSSGYVLKSTRYTMTLSCPMDLQLYPFDRQICSIELESFAGTNHEIQFKLKKDSIGVSREVSIPQFKYLGYKTRTSDSGDSRLTIDFAFQRAFGYYILQCYIPIAVAVIVSLLSLILANPVIGPLVHVVNICFVIYYGGQAWILKTAMVSFLKYLDVYLIISLTNIILCLIVSFGISYQLRNREADPNAVCSICKPLTELDAYRGSLPSQRLKRKSSCKCDPATILCCSLKLIIITLFVVSNVLYWLYVGHTVRTIEQENFQFST